MFRTILDNEKEAVEIINRALKLSKKIQDKEMH